MITLQDINKRIEGDVIEIVLNKIRKRIEKPNFKSKIEVARLSMSKLLEELNIRKNYKPKLETEEMNCSICHKPVEIIIINPFIKTLRSWRGICNGCFNMELSKYQEEIRLLKYDNSKILKEWKQDRESILQKIDEWAKANEYVGAKSTQMTLEDLKKELE